jgi:arylsulfatase A-like enzyme
MRTGRERYGRAPDLLVLFRLPDLICHTALAFSELVDEDEHLGASAEDLRRYGRTVTEAYRFMDRAVGQLIEAAGEEPNIVIVSDHGFDLESRWPDWKQSYDHAQGPDGLFLAAGPAFRPGEVEGLTILDVLPLVAEIKGLPIADDLDGREASVSLGERFVPPGPVRRVRTYGERFPSGAGLQTSGAEQEQMDRLRALGYMD